MQVLEMTSNREVSQKLFGDVAKAVYKDDPVWSAASENEFRNHWSQHLSGPDGIFVPIVIMDGDRPISRAVAILKNGALDDDGLPGGYIGFFECLENNPGAARLVLKHCERVLQESGAHSILVPKVDNQLFGCQISEFELPHVCLTPHNPPYYKDYFEAAGFKIKQHIYSLCFTRETAGEQINFSLPGFTTREFDRSLLAEEIAHFHRLQPQIFNDRSGYIPRTLTEDQAMIVGLLPFIDNDLIIIAENETGEPIGMLVCLPDYYQALDGQAIDRARIVSIGILPEYVKMGIGTLMGVHLMRNLLRKKQYIFGEASLVLAHNIAPQALAQRFPAKLGRSFVILGKAVTESQQAVQN